MFRSSLKICSMTNTQPNKGRIEVLICVEQWIFGHSRGSRYRFELVCRFRQPRPSTALNTKEQRIVVKSCLKPSHKPKEMSQKSVLALAEVSSIMLAISKFSVDKYTQESVYYSPANRPEFSIPVWLQAWRFLFQMRGIDWPTTTRVLMSSYPPATSQRAVSSSWTPRQLMALEIGNSSHLAAIITWETVLRALHYNWP